MIYLSSFALSDKKVKNPNLYPYSVFQDKAKAEKDGFQIEYKLMYSGVEHTFGEKIFKKKNSAGYVYTPTVQVFYRL